MLSEGVLLGSVAMVLKEKKKNFFKKKNHCPTCLLHFIARGSCPQSRKDKIPVPVSLALTHNLPC